MNKKIVEFTTSSPLELDEFVGGLKRFEEFDTFIIDECGGVGGAATAELVRREYDKEIFLKIICRDRNRIAIHSQLATAAAAGFTNLVLADGAHPIHTSFPDAKPVYELDSLGLLGLIKGHASGFPQTAKAFFVAPAEWRVGVCLGGCTEADMVRAKKFLDFGADLFFVSSLEAIQPLRRLTGLPIFLSTACDADIRGITDEAASAGAGGVNVVIGTELKGADGRTTSK